jgi:hypothetical protein
MTVFFMIALNHLFNLIGALTTIDSIAVYFGIGLDFISMVTLASVPWCRPLTIVLGGCNQQPQPRQCKPPGHAVGNDDDKRDLTRRKQPFSCSQLKWSPSNLAAHSTDTRNMVAVNRKRGDDSEGFDCQTITTVESRSQTSDVELILDYLKRQSMNLSHPNHRTTVRMCIGTLVACFIKIVGELMFVHTTWVHASHLQDQLQQQKNGHESIGNHHGEVSTATNKTTVGFVAAAMAMPVYTLSAITCSLVLTFGAGHVALVHNVFAAQLEELAALLRNQQRTTAHERSTAAVSKNKHMIQTSQQLENEEDEEEADDYADDSEEEKSGLLSTATKIQQEQQQQHQQMPVSACSVLPPYITATALMEVHVEFRRRQEALRGLHLRFIVALVTAGAVAIILVTQGFVEKQVFRHYDVEEDFSDPYETESSSPQTPGRFAKTPILVVALLATYFGQAYSMSSMVFSMGHVLYVSRERVAYEAAKWALLQSQSEQRRQEQRKCQERGLSRHSVPVGELSGSSCGAQETAQFLYAFPIRFHVGIFEFGEESVKAVLLLLLGLAAAFVGVHMPDVL